MKTKFLIQNNCGLTLLEVLVAVSIITTTIVLSFGVIASINKQSKHSEVVSQILVFRNNIINTLRNKNVWASIVNNNESMECIKDFEDCRGLGGLTDGEFDVYLENNTLSYSSSSVNQGYDLNGNVCNNFVPPGSTGNSLCPIKLKLYWFPVCHPTESCVKPAIRIRGVFTINTPQALFEFNLSRINFDLIQTTQYCDEQILPATLVANDSGTALNVVGNVSVQSTDLNSRPGGFASIQEDITYCNSVKLSYKINMIVPSSSANNVSDICFYAPVTASPLTANCTFAMRQIYDGTKNTYQLEEFSAVVYTSPTGITSADTFEFGIKNGVVKFYQNSSLRYIFQNPVVNKTRVKFKPASLTFSPSGINSINLYLDN